MSIIFLDEVTYLVCVDSFYLRLVPRGFGLSRKLVILFSVFEARLTFFFTLSSTDFFHHYRFGRICFSQSLHVIKFTHKSFVGSRVYILHLAIYDHEMGTYYILNF